jgi:pimeloyl-ACP methyl ester carboxylesterase
VIVGTHDQHFPPSSLAALAAHEVHLVAGADHFLFDRDDEVAALVAGALR